MSLCRSRRSSPGRTVTLNWFAPRDERQVRLRTAWHGSCERLAESQPSSCSGSPRGDANEQHGRSRPISASMTVSHAGDSSRSGRDGVQLRLLRVDLNQI
jgi:hypothetical protein